MKVALFGGSFNPIHNGHLEIADSIIKEKIADEVWFIPCGNHPFNKKLINGQDRIKMINLSIKNNPRLKLLDLEILSDNISFTSETIKFLKEKFREIEFYFVIGTDNLIDLQKWHDFEYIKKNTEFILVERPKYELTNNLGIKIINSLPIKSLISSTQIRYLLNNNYSIEDLVPEEIELYIKKEGLNYG